MYRPDAPLIVQADASILAEVHAPGYAQARDQLARFAELVKSPEHVHTYRLSPLSLWNAASSGMTAAEMIATLEAHSKYDLPQNVLVELAEQVGRFGRLALVPGTSEATLELVASDEALANELAASKARALFGSRAGPTRFTVPVEHRGEIKQALCRLGWPVDDQAGFSSGEALALAMRETTAAGRAFQLYPFQTEAVDIFHAGGSGGNGVIVLPCGSGKTVVGLSAIARAQTSTLVLCANTTAVRQWISELLDKTSLTPDQIGEYTGEAKEVRPVTVATYQILSYRPGQKKGASKDEDAPPVAHPHFALFTARAWGLIVYDEVHLLPAPVFRMTAAIQARRRLGLTATLIREDGHEADVFSLIGPKRYDVPWKEMEKNGHIAQASCHEIRVPLSPDDRARYNAAEHRNRFRVAAENRIKAQVVKELVEKHRGEQVLVIGQFLEQLAAIATTLEAPLMTGQTPQATRERLFADFRSGKAPVLVLSKVGNFSVDLPDASVCIQVSGSYGSRQEEAQRLGRLLRPKARQAWFYTVVSRETEEQRFATRRQLFLTEQGYRYYIEDFSFAKPPAGAEVEPRSALIDLDEERRRRAPTLH